MTVRFSPLHKSTYISDKKPNTREPTKEPRKIMLSEKLISQVCSQTSENFVCAVLVNTLLSQTGSSHGHVPEEFLAPTLQTYSIGGARNIKLKTCQNIGTLLKNKRKKK